MQRQGRCSGKRKTQDETVYDQNWWKNQFGSQLFPFVKFSFPATRLMPYYAETGHSRPYSPDLIMDNSYEQKLNKRTMRNAW